MGIPLPHFQMGRAGTGQGWKTGSSEPACDGRTPAKARPLGVQRRADLEVNTDEFTGFHTGLPLVAVVGGVYGDGCARSLERDKCASATCVLLAPS